MLEKYPNVRVSVAHLGGFQYVELIDTNTYVNISAILTDLVERCNLEETNKILRSFGVDRLVFATDYPDNRRLEAKVIYDKYIELLGMMDFTEEEAKKICMFNAEK